MRFPSCHGAGEANGAQVEAKSRDPTVHSRTPTAARALVSRLTGLAFVEPPAVAETRARKGVCGATKEDAATTLITMMDANVHFPRPRIGKEWTESWNVLVGGSAPFFSLVFTL